MHRGSLIKKINNRIVLYCAITFFFVPFIVFSFWNFPSADDYMIIDKKSQFNFWELQSFVYHNWTGRYFATFISSIFSYSGFLYSHYYFHSLLLLLLTVFSWVFCLAQLNKYFLRHFLSLSAVIVLSLLAVILETNIIPEPVTAFYWFSSAVTYQLPLIILILLTGIIIKLLSTSPNRTVLFITAGVLIIMLNGCNEIISLFVLVNFSLLLGYSLLTNKKVPFFIISLYVLILITAFFLIFSPGILNRQSKLAPGSLSAAVGIAVIKFFILHWFFLKEPLWWFFVFFISTYLKINGSFFDKIYGPLISIPPSTILLLYFTGGVLIYIPVLYSTNGSLPLRAENIICYLYSLVLLFVAAIYISHKMLNAQRVLYRYRYLLLTILIFSSTNTKNITDSLLSGYFYSQVMKERLSLFKDAKQKNEHEVTFESYEVAVSKKIKDDFPIADRQVLKEIILKPPPIICFKSDLYDLNYMKEYYGIRKLNVEK